MLRSLSLSLFSLSPSLSLSLPWLLCMSPEADAQRRHLACAVVSNRTGCRSGSSICPSGAWRHEMVSRAICDRDRDGIFCAWRDDGVTCDCARSCRFSCARRPRSRRGSIAFCASCAPLLLCGLGNVPRTGGGVWVGGVEGDLGRGCVVESRLPSMPRAAGHGARSLPMRLPSRGSRPHRAHT